MAHHHILGKSGSGKTTLLKQWLLDRVHEGVGVCYIDPHGFDTDDLLNYIPKNRREDVIVFDPTRYSIPWNPLETDTIPLTASVFVDSFKSAWGYSTMTTPRIDGVLYNALTALMEAKEGLFGLYLILTSQEYRNELYTRIQDPVVLRYWQWFDSLNSRDKLDQIDSTLNKVQALMADPRIRAIASAQSLISIPTLVHNKILFIRLPQGELGVQKSALIGSLLLSQVHHACLRRSPETPYYVFIDEVHSFAPHTIAEMLSGIRKYNVHVTIVHQYLDQLDDHLRASAKANCETLTFQVSLEDSAELPPVPVNNLQPFELPQYTLYRWYEGRSVIQTTTPLTYEPYPASYRQVDSNLRRNYHRPANKEVDALLARY